MFLFLFLHFPYLIIQNIIFWGQVMKKCPLDLNSIYEYLYQHIIDLSESNFPNHFQYLLHLIREIPFIEIFKFSGISECYLCGDEKTAIQKDLGKTLC